MPIHADSPAAARTDLGSPVPPCKLLLTFAVLCSDQPTGRLALVFELMDMNIYELIRGRRHYVVEHRIRNYMYQLTKAMDHMHRCAILTELKTALSA